MNSAITLRAWRTNTTLRTWRMKRPPRGRNRGSLTSPPIRTRRNGADCSPRVRRCRHRGPRRRSKRWRSRFRPAAGRFAPNIGPKMRWRRCSAKSVKRPPRCSPRARTDRRWGRSKEPCTRDAATTGRRRIASCSRATKWASAPCAGGPSSGLSIFTRGLHLDEKHFHRARAQVTDGACVAIKPAGLAAFHAHILSASVETLKAQVALVDAHGERIHVVVHVHGLVRLQREPDGAHVRIFEIQVVMRRIDRQRVAAIEPPLWNNVRRKPLLPVRAQSQHCKEEETHARSYHWGRATPASVWAGVHPLADARDSVNLAKSTRPLPSRDRPRAQKRVRLQARNSTLRPGPCDTSRINSANLYRERRISPAPLMPGVHGKPLTAVAKRPCSLPCIPERGAASLFSPARAAILAGIANLRVPTLLRPKGFPCGASEGAIPARSS